MSALHWLVLFLVSARHTKAYVGRGGSIIMEAFIGVERQVMIPYDLCILSSCSLLPSILYGMKRRL